MKTIVCFGFVLGALSAAGEVFVATPGKSATMMCGVNTFTRKLEWHRGSDKIVSYFSRNSPPALGKIGIAHRSRIRETTLEISRLTKEDAGQFVCIVDGKRHEHTLLILSVSVEPSSPLQLGSEATLKCQVSGLTPDPPVQWKSPDGKPHKGDLKPVARSHQGTWECTLSHSGKTYSESLNIEVKDPAPTTSAPIQNGKKNDHKTTCPNCATNPPSSTAQLLGLSWWMWVVVGVGCLVVVLLMVFVIVLYKRIKTRKRKLLKLKNSRQPLTPRQYCECNRPTAAAKPQQGRRREKSSAPPLQLPLIE